MILLRECSIEIASKYVPARRGPHQSDNRPYMMFQLTTEDALAKLKRIRL